MKLFRKFLILNMSALLSLLDIIDVLVFKIRSTFKKNSKDNVLNQLAQIEFDSAWQIEDYIRTYNKSLSNHKITDLFDHCLEERFHTKLLARGKRNYLDPNNSRTHIDLEEKYLPYYFKIGESSALKKYKLLTSLGGIKDSTFKIIIEDELEHENSIVSEENYDEKLYFKAFTKYFTLSFTKYLSPIFDLIAKIIFVFLYYIFFVPLAFFTGRRLKYHD